MPTKLKILGRNGTFLIVKKGRLAEDAELADSLPEVLQHCGTDTELLFDTKAVILLKDEYTNPV